MMIIRKNYLDKIKPYIGKPMVKAITGLRRVGKSVFIRQLIDILKSNNVNEQNIIYVDMESLEFDHIKNYIDLNEYVLEKSAKCKGKVYVFVDEIQDILEWEKAIASWSGEHQRFDVIITGSNSNLFAGGLATKLTGRYIEFPIYPLSFTEFKKFHPTDSSTDTLFENYTRLGGMPGIHALDVLSDDLVFPLLRSIHDSILLNDVVKRWKIRNIGNLERICNFTYDNIAQMLNAQAINKYLKNQKLELNLQTIIEYLDALISAQLFYKVQRYDIKGKRQLEINHKFFATDLGLRNAKIGYHADDIGQVLENLVYMELLRNGADVYVGQIDKWEVDFIAEKNGKPHYYQVTTMLSEPETVERETRSLLAIADNYPKSIVTLYPVFGNEINGIEVISILDFLSGSGA